MTTEAAPEEGEEVVAAAEAPRPSRRATVTAQVERLITAIRTGDEAIVERTVLVLSQRSRWLAPLALLVGAFAMLFQGVKLLFTNWKLTLVQILPAMWIWAAMLDLKAHALHGKEFHLLRGPLLGLVLLVIAGLTAGSFFLNGCLRLCHIEPGAPEIRPAFAEAQTARPHDPGLGLGRGIGAGVRHHGRRSVGEVLVLVDAQHRSRRHDDRLRRRPGPTDRAEVRAVDQGQADRFGGGRRGRGGGLHAAVRAWAVLPSFCSAPIPSGTWPSAAGHRHRPPDRSDELGQSDQNECQARSGRGSRI